VAVIYEAAHTPDLFAQRGGRSSACLKGGEGSGNQDEIKTGGAPCGAPGNLATYNALKGKPHGGGQGRKTWDSQNPQGEAYR